LWRQNPQEDSVSNLDFFNKSNLALISDIFYHKTGACNAQEFGFKPVESEWVFFNDDDNKIWLRFSENVFLKEQEQYGANIITTARICKA
jgi:hypothetical protein